MATADLGTSPAIRHSATSAPSDPAPFERPDEHVPRALDHMRVHRRSTPARTLVGASSLLLLATGMAGAQTAESGAPGISVSAIGEVKSAPDRAEILFSVETRAATAEAASQQNATRQTAVIAALRAAGLAADEVGTVSYTLQPEMTYDEATRASRVVGYVARNSVRAEVRDIARTGRVIDAAIRAGANEVSSLQFSTSRREALRLDAIRLAVQRACREATALAAAAGATLGPMVQASTADSPNYPSPPPMPMMRVQAEAATTPITPQDIATTVSVYTRWSFVPAGIAAGTEAPTCR